ncbi:hypothetical protein GOBAR_AA38244 [Gossypium barbadense]|uniref:NET domain-containing protein n=1 Tax=Gossypium barbadense TaxID=3634 RepID=A0A2P5VUF8_GOSBA|nr:hypothetical protein GOBAR_AA38244 [Gossypium barbadense]
MVKPEPIRHIMTDREKHNLSTKLESLLGELPENIVDFLKEQSSSDGQMGEDEIEIDIDALSHETLYKLGNDQIDEVVDIVGSSYPPVAIEKELTHRNSRCCSSSGSSGESGFSSSLVPRETAIFSGADRSVTEKMYEYGKNLGLSFQVVDDILDFAQSAEQLGKPASSHLAKGNLTALVIFTLEKEPKLRDIIESDSARLVPLKKKSN